jgi:hypothetical protein
MQQSSGLTGEGLLNLLLDRFETPRQRARDITQAIDYTRVGGPAAQDEFHRVLHDAERTGGIVLERARLGRFTGEFARARLVDADKLYRFLVRSPAGEIADVASRRIGETIPDVLEDPFFAEVEREATAAWRSNKSYLGLSRTQVDTFSTVMRLAHGIVHLTGRDVDHRTFSRRTVKDSKALERSEGRIAQLLKRRNAGLAGDEPREILEASGIVRRAHLLQVKGPLRLSSDALSIEGTGEMFIGLPWAAAQQATLMKPVDYIITIENPTSFWRYCTEIGGCYLALLSDGFPARDVLSSMVHLVKAARAITDAPIYHWGDIDAGGVRIAAHLEDAFGIPVQLHQMQHNLPWRRGRRCNPVRACSGLLPGRVMLATSLAGFVQMRHRRSNRKSLILRHPREVPTWRQAPGTEWCW